MEHTFYMGIDPGYTNIGVCVIGGENYGVVISECFSIKETDKERVENVQLDCQTYVQRLKRKLGTLIFDPLRKMCMDNNIAQPTVFCMIEQQYKNQYTFISAIIATILSNTGISSRVVNCNTVRAALGIPCAGTRPIIKDNVLTFCSCTGFDTKNDHMGDAYTLAVHCRQVLEKKLPNMITPPVYQRLAKTQKTPTASKKRKPSNSKKVKPVKKKVIKK